MLERDHPKLPLKVQAELLRLSYSSLFYQPVPPSERELAIKRRIDEIYTAHPYYGSRKITEELRPEFGVARSTIQRYMQEMGIFALDPGSHTSKPTPEHQIFPYLLRGVTATHPNDIWGIDITYVRLAHGWLYLTAILDWYSRYIVSWALSQTLALDFVQRWTMLCSRPHPRSGTATRAATLPVISTSNACKTLVFKSVWTGAVGARDNIFTEWLWPIKYEEVYLHDYASPKEAYRQLASYIYFYNFERPHQALDYQMPAQLYGTVIDCNLNKPLHLNSTLFPL